LLLILVIRGFYKPRHYKRGKPSGSKREKEAAAQQLKIGEKTESKKRTREATVNPGSQLQRLERDSFLSFSFSLLYYLT